MATQRSYLIIGNGIAGTTAAETLRSEEQEASITMIADDPVPVYYRPALKDYLAGRVREEKLWARTADFYQEQRILCLADRVVAIQRDQRVVLLQSGRQVGYTRLLLANGARPAHLTCPGSTLRGVTTLRTIADYQAVLHLLPSERQAVVVGSGTLALETVEGLRQRGYPVAHLLRRRALWSEVLDPTASDLVLQQERRDGVDVYLEEEVGEITGEQGQVTGVVTTSGRHIPCDLVLVAIGIVPNIDFLQRSGIVCGRGVRVDGQMRTSAHDIYAAEDVLETTDGRTGRTRLIGQWYPAIQQARAAAYSMLNLSETMAGASYHATFLYGLDCASVGLTTVQGPHYQEIRAAPQPRMYKKAVLSGGMPIGMLSLGDRKGVLAFKRAIDHGVNLPPIASILFADSFNLTDWLDQQGVPPPILGVSRAPVRVVGRRV